MKILVVNAGSSSLKYQLFDMDTNEVLAKGLCERIGIDGVITHKRPGKEDYSANEPLADHKAAIELVLKLLCTALRESLEAYLDGRVAITLHGLLLHDSAGTRFDDGNGNDAAVFQEELRHADLRAENRLFHVTWHLQH